MKWLHVSAAGEVSDLLLQLCSCLLVRLFIDFDLIKGEKATTIKLLADVDVFLIQAEIQ